MLPTRQALIPDLVPRRMLLNAISLNSAFMNVTRIGAPALGGLLLAKASASVVFFIMAGMVFISAGIMFFLPKTESRPRRNRASLLGDMGETFGYLKTKPVLVNLMIIAFAAVIFGLPFQLMLPIFTEDYLKVGPQGLGTLLSLTGLGALLGSLLVASLGNYPRKGMLLLALTFVWGVTIVVFTAFQHWVLAMALMLPMGMASTARATINQTLLQSNIDDGMRARVMGLYMMEVGMQPLGSVPMSALAEVMGTPIAVGAAGLIISVVATWGWFFKPIVRKLS
jgi:MFS family permease